MRAFIVSSVLGGAVCVGGRVPLILALEAPCCKPSNLLCLQRWDSGLGFSLQKTEWNDPIQWQQCVWVSQINASLPVKDLVVSPLFLFFFPVVFPSRTYMAWLKIFSSPALNLVSLPRACRAQGSPEDVCWPVQPSLMFAAASPNTDTNQGRRWDMT